MTTPTERTRAVVKVGLAVQALAPYLHGRGETVRVPRDTVRELFALLHHYPMPGDMEGLEGAAREAARLRAALEEIAGASGFGNIWARNKARQALGDTRIAQP